MAIYRGRSGPPGPKPRKSLKKISRGLRARGPRESGKSLEKVFSGPFRDFFQTLETFSRLSHFFQTFSGFRAQRARETPVNGQRTGSQLYFVGPKNSRKAPAKFPAKKHQEKFTDELRMRILTRLEHSLANFSHKSASPKISHKRVFTLNRLTAGSANTVSSPKTAHKHKEMGPQNWTLDPTPKTPLEILYAL